MFGLLFAVGFVGLLVLGWSWRRASSAETRSLLGRTTFALASSLLIALGTLPSSSPFQPGSALGIGVLGGAVGMTFAMGWHLWRQQGWFPFLFTLLPFLIPLLAFAGNPFPTLYGLLVQATLSWFWLGAIYRAYALLVISVAAAVALARWHTPPEGLDKYVWQSVPCVLAFVGWLVAGLVAAWKRYWQSSVKEFSGLFGSALLLLLGAGALGYWLGDHRFFVTVMLACLAALLARGLQSSSQQDLTGLVWVSLLVFSFVVFPTGDGWQLLRGYGAALMAIALLWLAVSTQEESSPLWQGAILLIAFGLFRLFAEAYPLRAPRADLYTHYTFVGFLLGVVFPPLLQRWGIQSLLVSRTLWVGLWSASVPLVLGAVWGVKAVAGYLGGSIAGALLSPIQPMPVLFAGFATALPLTVVVEPASDLPRHTRLWMLVTAAGVLLFLVLLDTLGQRWVQKRSFELEPTHQG